MQPIFTADEIKEYATVIYLLNDDDNPSAMDGYQVIDTRINNSDDIVPIPTYYVLRKNKTLFIWIRGTRVDFINDIMISAHSAVINYMKGIIHEGYYNGAVAIIQQQYQILKQKWDRIICLGHSLGGVSAQIMATLLRFDHKIDNAFALAFASPPSCSYEISGLTRAFIYSFVFDDDPVPKLGPLFRELRCLAECREEENPEDSEIPNNPDLVILGSILVMHYDNGFVTIKPNDMYNDELKEPPSLEVLACHLYDRYYRSILNYL